MVTRTVIVRRGTTPRRARTSSLDLQVEAVQAAIRARDAGARDSTVYALATSADACRLSTPLTEA